MGVCVCVYICACGDNCPFNQAKYVSLCQTGAGGSYWSSPEAKALLLIWSGLLLVMDADPRLDSQSINIDCDEQEN